MRRHPARDVDADRRDLPRALTPARRHPDAGQALVAHALELERGERPDERLLEVAHVALHVLAVVPEVEDRVADELSRPVERGLAAAVGLDDLDRGVLRDVELALGLGAPPDRDDRRVLEEDHRLGIAPCETAPASERCSSNASA